MREPSRKMKRGLTLGPVQLLALFFAAATFFGTAAVTAYVAHLLLTHHA